MIIRTTVSLCIESDKLFDSNSIESLLYNLINKSNGINIVYCDCLSISSEENNNNRMENKDGNK